MHGDFFPIGSHGPAYFPPTKNLHLNKWNFFKENCKIQAKCGIKMTRKYPFFIQIAYIALFWNSVGPIYSTKKVANQKRCVGGVLVELNLFLPFRIKKTHFSEKKFS